MHLKEVFAPHYDYYLKHFTAVLNDIKKSEKGISEVLLEQKNDEPEDVYRLYRPDFLTKENTIIEINTDGYLNHEPQEYGFSDITVVIHPFLWNGCEIFLNTRPSNWIFLDNWIRKWIKLDEDLDETNSLYTEAIHKVEKPYVENEWEVIAVDLGTAPPDSLVELIELILGNGFVKRIEIGSPTMLNNEQNN